MTQVDSTKTVFYCLEQTLKEYRRYAQNRISLVVPNITLDQALLLALINDGIGNSQSDLAQILFKNFASTTRMIELLVKKGFLSRSINDKDRRKTSLKLTSKGQIAIEALIPIIFENRRHALEEVTEIDQEHLMLTLNKITRNCKNHSK